ncbi:MAG: MATE family efflux transporter [Planctomycetaceae bacterium]|jgi:MATE family multidrug resistance protein
MSPSAPDPPDAGPAAGSLRELLQVAVPLMLSAGTLSIMNAADRAMLTGWSRDSLAAVTPAGMMYWTIVCIPIGMILYANTFIAQFDGAGQPQKMMASLWQAIWLALVCGTLLMLCPLISGPALSLTTQPAAVIAEEKAYFDTLCLGCPLMMLTTALSCFYSGRRRTRVILAVNLFSVMVNFGVDYLLIFGRAGFPALGIQGAALATLSARFCEVVIYTTLITRKANRRQFRLFACWKPDRELLVKFLRFGFPSGAHYFVDNLGFTAFLFILGSLSRDALAASNLAFGINALIYVPLLGFGTAVQTLVGHHIGADLKAAATRTTWNAVILATVWTGAMAVMLVVFPVLCLQPFLAFAQSGKGVEAIESILPTAAMLLQFVAVYSVFDALAVVFASSLRGAGDTVFPMLLTMFSSWFIMALPAWWIVRQEGSEIHHVWWTATVHVLVMGVLMMGRFLTGRWKLIQIV